MALGTIIAAVLAGWAAAEMGFAALDVTTAVSGGAAAVLGLVALRSPERGQVA